MRTRPGYISSSLFFTGSIFFIMYKGPLIDDPLLRYTMAGTAATLFTETGTHAVDTVNMRSKVINGKKLYVY